jgi:hypothetical protein
MVGFCFGAFSFSALLFFENRNRPGVTKGVTHPTNGVKKLFTGNGELFTGMRWLGGQERVGAGRGRGESWVGVVACMPILPFILYGVTERVTEVTKRVTDGGFNRSKRRKRRKQGRGRPLFLYLPAPAVFHRVTPVAI